MINSKDDTEILFKVMDTVFDIFYDPLYVLNGEGKFLRVNEAFSRFYGYSQKELIGKNIENIFDLKGFSTITAKKALEKGMRVTDKEVIGSNREIAVTAIPVFNDENIVVRVVCHVKDLTNTVNARKTNTYHFGENKDSDIVRNDRPQNEPTEIIISQSQNVKEAFNLGKRVADVNSTVLILGESGVGKNVLAQTIHKQGCRRNSPFIELNCGALSESLLESELFGYAPGSFTGAMKEGKKGHIEMANNGTIFLDEVGEMSQALQVKLLHFLQNKTITRIGSSTSIKVDVRVIAATNKNLETLVNDGEFRRDLYYRLNVIPIKLPPLKERREEIIPLFMHFLKQFKNQYGIERKISNKVFEKLVQYSWPGNVRELQNVVERLVVTSIDETITLQNLPANILHDDLHETVNEREFTLMNRSIEMEAQEIISVYKKYKSTYKAAAALGMSQSTFFRKLRKYEKTYGDLFI